MIILFFFLPYELGISNKKKLNGLGKMLFTTKMQSTRNCSFLTKNIAYVTKKIVDNHKLSIHCFFISELCY